MTEDDSLQQKSDEWDKKAEKALGQMDAYSTGGHLTVRRDLEGGGHLVQIWELENLAWCDPENRGEYDVVKCHVANVNDVPNDGVPHPSDRVSYNCSFEDLPKEVRREFVEQAGRVRETLNLLQLDDE